MNNSTDVEPISTKRTIFYHSLLFVVSAFLLITNTIGLNYDINFVKVEWTSIPAILMITTMFLSLCAMVLSGYRLFIPNPKQKKIKIWLVGSVVLLLPLGLYWCLGLWWVYQKNPMILKFPINFLLGTPPFA